MSKVIRPSGLVSVTRIVDALGQDIPFEKAVRYGWISPTSVQDSPNLFVDAGRQLLAYAFGFRSPISDYVCSKFGVGTGTVSARVTDVALQAPVILNSGLTVGNIDSIDFLTAFVVRVAFTLCLADANGFALTEFGLFSGNNTMLARKTRSVAINKTGDFSPTVSWRIRF